MAPATSTPIPSEKTITVESSLESRRVRLLHKQQNALLSTLVHLRDGADIRINGIWLREVDSVEFIFDVRIKLVPANEWIPVRITSTMVRRIGRNQAHETRWNYRLSAYPDPDIGNEERLVVYQTLFSNPSFGAGLNDRIYVIHFDTTGPRARLVLADSRLW